MKVNQRNYKSKKVFAGIDVHKEKYVITCICEDIVVKKWSMISCPHTLSGQFKTFFKGAEIFSAYEAGFSGFNLHRVLVRNGIDNIVINAASIEMRTNDRVKTDKRDALKIADQLRVGRLKGIYVPSLKEERNRSLSRGREQVVRHRQRIGNQIKMKIHNLGIRLPKNQRSSERFLLWVESLELSEEHRFVLDELCQSWREQSQRIIRFNKVLKKQAEEDVERETILRSVPGVGALSSRLLSNELGDTSRFSNAQELYSYTGLTPCEHSSGETIRKGHITRQGPGRIRAALVEIAWRAVNSNSNLMLMYRQIAQRRGAKRAIVAIARKLLGRIRFCLMNKVKWSENIQTT